MNTNETKTSTICPGCKKAVKDGYVCKCVVQEVEGKVSHVLQELKGSKPYTPLQGIALINDTWNASTVTKVSTNLFFKYLLSRSPATLVKVLLECIGQMIHIRSYAGLGPVIRLLRQILGPAIAFRYIRGSCLEAFVKVLWTLLETFSQMLQGVGATTCFDDAMWAEDLWTILYSISVIYSAKPQAAHDVYIEIYIAPSPLQSPIMDIFRNTYASFEILEKDTKLDKPSLMSCSQGQTLAALRNQPYSQATRFHTFQLTGS